MADPVGGGVIEDPFPSGTAAPTASMERVAARSADLLTVREVADALRVSTMTVYRLIKAGELACTRVGKGYRIRPGDLDRYLGLQHT